MDLTDEPRVSAYPNINEVNWFSRPLRRYNYLGFAKFTLLDVESRDYHIVMSINRIEVCEYLGKYSVKYTNI